jgi:hypothetical protein
LPEFIIRRAVGGHRVQEGDVVDLLTEMREQVADVLAALAVLFELPARLNDAAPVLVAAAPKGLDLHGLVVAAIHLRLVVERVDLARTTIHIQEDTRRRVGVVVRRLGGQRVLVRSQLVGLCTPRQKFLPEHRRQGDRRKPTTGFPEHLAAGATTEVLGRHDDSGEVVSDLEGLRAGVLHNSRVSVAAEAGKSRGARSTPRVWITKVGSCGILPRRHGGTEARRHEKVQRFDRAGFDRMVRIHRMHHPPHVGGCIRSFL